MIEQGGCNEEYGLHKAKTQKLAYDGQDLKPMDARILRRILDPWHRRVQFVQEL
jgi:hypothetical protein